MRVLHIIPTLGAGGAEKLLLDLSKGMKNRGLDVEVLVLSNKKHFYHDSIKEYNIPVYFGNSNKIYSLTHIRTIYKIMRKKYDVIHTHLYPAQLSFVLACLFRKKQAKYFTTEHSTHNRRKNNALFKVLDKLMYSKYDKIIAISEDTKKILKDKLNIKDFKIEVINNGIDYNKFRNSIKIKRINLVPDYQPNDFLILMVAGFRKAKDYRTIIDTASYLSNEYKFLLVGDGTEREKMELYAKKNNVSNVYFLGSRKDVPNIMKSVDLFVLSSFWEGFGLVAVEAMASGLPVIGTNVPGLRKIINKSGVLFEVQDVKKLLYWIKRMKNEMEIRRLYSLKGIERSKKFKIEDKINEYIYLYENN